MNEKKEIERLISIVKRRDKNNNRSCYDKYEKMIERNWLSSDYSKIEMLNFIIKQPKAFEKFYIKKYKRF